MSQFFTLLTKTGQGLLANAIAYGQPLTIAELAIGDGGGTLPAPDASVTQLVNEVRRGPINQASNDADNPNWTVVEQVLPPDVGGWTIREVGLYDTEGNLIAYGNYPETYKPQLSEGSSRTQTIRFIMEVTDTSAVTLKIDPSVVMASREYVDKSIDAHAKSRNHPYADTVNQGMVKFATLTAAKAGTDTKTALAPAGGMAQLDDRIAEQDTVNTGEDDNKFVTPLKLQGKTATTAEAQALSSLSKIITPKRLADAFQGGNQSLAVSGYQRLPGGLIIQWVTGGTSAVEQAVSFPIAFPNTALALAICDANSGGAGVPSSNQVLSYRNLTASSVSLIVVNPDGVASPGSGYSLIVVGC